MNNNEKRPPTWVKTDSSGSQFVSYDDDLSTFQLQTLDKIVENIELCYDYNRAKQGANTNNDYAEMSESYMYKRAKDPIGRWSWRDSTDRTYYKLPSRISSSFRLNNDNYEQRYQQQKLIQVNKPQDDLPQQGSYLYNCFSKETSGQVRAYLNKLYLDLVEKADKPWSAKPAEVAAKVAEEEEEEEEEESETSQTNVTDIKPEKEKPEAKSPFPKIVPLTSEQKPRSIMKNTNNRMSSKYEQKLFDVYSNLTKEKMKQKQKQEDGFDTDHSLNDDVFHPSTSSGIASTSSNPNESIISTKLLKEQPDHQRASIASIASSSRMVNNDDTDLDQDESGTLTPPIAKKPILSSGSMKAVTGFVSEKPEPKKLVQTAPFNEPTRDIYSRKTVQIPTRDTRARDESTNYFQFPPVNQQKQQQTPKQQQQQRKAAPSKLGRLSENADRIVENINNRFQPSKTQLGRIKDVSEPPESKIKFLSNFSSKFIEKANKIQHKR